MRKKGSFAELEQVRLTAANMFEQGLSTGQVAGSLGADDQSVRRWRRAFDAGGRDALRSRPHPGRPPRLTAGQRDALAGMLVRAPRELGLGDDRHLWTCELIARLIEREFGGVRYHPDYVGTLLHALGFTHQAPARRAAERDGARIEAWRHDAWPALLKKRPTRAG